MTARTKGVLCILASAFGFAVMGLCIRLADSYGTALSAFQKSFFRNLVAWLVVTVLLMRPSARPVCSRLPRAAWGPLAARCLFGTVGIVGNFYAHSHIPLGDAGMLNKLSPFAAILASWLFLGERLRVREGVAVVVAFMGALLVVKPGFALTGAAWPAAVGLLGGVAAGAAYVCVRRLGLLGVPSACIVWVFSAFSTVAMVPFLLADYVPMTGAQVWILLGAGVAATVGQFGITAAYRLAPSRELAVYDYLNVVFAVVFGFIVFGQVPDAFSWAGMALIVAMGVWRQGPLRLSRRGS